MASAAVKRARRPLMIAERPVKDVIFLGAALVIYLPRVLVWNAADRFADHVRGRRRSGTSS